VPDSATNLDLSLAALSIQHHQLEVELTQQELSPTVSVIGDAGLLTSIDNLRVPYAERAGILGYSVGILLEIPFFNWGQPIYAFSKNNGPSATFVFNLS